MDAGSIKKGPWTSEEDLILVTYIQQHGPRNWKYVPVNTGLMRCSKSCRLRWTNYLRPGIRRGNFTSHEERIIIHLQSLLGNKWAAIASYLPQRTDNDIKNYWNTHLKKKIKNYKTALDSINIHLELEPEIEEMSTPQPTLPKFYNTSSTYAASADNISRLLKSWTEPTSDSTATSCTTVVTSNANQEQGESALFDISQYESLDWNDNSSIFEMFGDVDAAGEIEDFAEQWRWIK